MASALNVLKSIIQVWAFMMMKLNDNYPIPESFQGHFFGNTVNIQNLI
jgi:hypothetical protein